MAQLEKNQQIKELLHLTISNCDIDARIILSDLSEKILKEYTMTSLLEELVDSILNNRFDRFLVKLVSDKNLSSDPKQVPMELCKDTINKLNDVGYVFWNTVYEANAIVSLKERVELILTQWLEFEKLNQFQDDDKIDFSIFQNNHLALFIIVFKLYNMFVTLILTREESKLPIQEE